MICACSVVRKGFNPKECLVCMCLLIASTSSAFIPHSASSTIFKQIGPPFSKLRTFAREHSLGSMTHPELIFLVDPRKFSPLCMIRSEKQAAGDSFDTANSEDLVAMTVFQLKKELKGRGLKSTGNKDVLILRLTESLGRASSVNQGALSSSPIQPNSLPLTLPLSCRVSITVFIFSSVCFAPLTAKLIFP